MITNDALERMDRLAHEIGFGHRDDYPHRSASAISAGDWKGHSIVACVFAHDSHAQQWAQACKDKLAAVDGVTATVMPGTAEGLRVAVISGTDLRTAD